MKKFIKNIIIFFFINSVILVLLFRFNNESFKIHLNNYDYVFYKKADTFNNFIKEKKSINLILGSSLIEESLIPDSLGFNWFSFTNGSQNIDESLKFINFYKDLIVIDTVIIEIQPFNFSRLNDIQHNGNFYFYGFDFTSAKRISKILKKHLQYLKSKIFPKNFTFFNTSNSINNERIVSNHGYSGRMIKALDIDSLYKYEPNRFNYASSYFDYINDKPNYNIFELFLSLTKKLDIKVIYIIPPKSKYYKIELKNNRNRIIWDNILNKLEKKGIEIWNYENMKTDDFNFHWFWDETHVGYDGAKAFTKLIKKKLKKN